MSSSVSPSEEEVLAAFEEVQSADASLGLSKIRLAILEKKPKWVLSENRLKTIRNKHQNTPSDSTSAQASENTSLPPLKLAPLKPEERRKALEERMENVPASCHEQIRMHLEAMSEGVQRGAGWYALLRDGEEEYELENVEWVGVGSDKGSVKMLEKAKLDSIMEKELGCYVLFTYLNAQRQSGPCRSKISERRLARQLQDEYGLDPWAVKTRLDAGDADLAKQVQDLHLTYAAGNQTLLSKMKR